MTAPNVIRRVFDKRITIALGIGFAAGIALAVLYFHIVEPQMQQVKVVRESDIASSTAYMFTDPLIGVTSGNTTSPAYASLRTRINSYIASEATAGLDSASVNFRDIDASQGFTINPAETYDPASLTKIPLAMAYYDLAEENSSVLSDQIFYSGDPDLDADEQIRSVVQLVPGESYTVEEMIEHMIRYSDNNAEQLLADHLVSLGQLEVLNKLFADLGIKTNASDPDYATAGSYSVFLRVLYNSTYLDREYSERLLQLMSQTDFTQGIESGIPNGVLVAQKFGDAKIPDAAGNVAGAELQNCGIVYYPDHPYILCIMTKGRSIDELERVLASISRIVFEDTQQRYPSQT